MSGRGYNSSQTLISRDIKAPVQINQEYKQVNNKKFSLSLLQQLSGVNFTGKLGELRKKCPRSASNFTPAMRDYRNLLNFRILDYLNENGLLREELNSKQWD